MQYDSKTENNKFLYMEYSNIEGSFGFQNGKYNTNLASKQITKGLKDQLTNYNGKEYYYFGSYDGIFGRGKNNKEVAQKTSDVILTKLIDNSEDICVIGYGQSGSGKTSALIYLETTNKKEDGILIETCKLQKFIETYVLISLEMYNIYIC